MTTIQVQTKCFCLHELGHVIQRSRDQEALWLPPLCRFFVCPIVGSHRGKHPIKRERCIQLLYHVLPGFVRMYCYIFCTVSEGEGKRVLSLMCSTMLWCEKSFHDGDQHSLLFMMDMDYESRRKRCDCLLLGYILNLFTAEYICNINGIKLHICNNQLAIFNLVICVDSKSALCICIAKLGLQNEKGYHLWGKVFNTLYHV